MSNFISLKNLCSEIGISLATGKNWIRLGKLTPSVVDGNKYFFSLQEVQRIVQNLKNVNNSNLKSRRNKNFVCGNSIYKSYLSSESPNVEKVRLLMKFVNSSNITQELILAILAHCALSLFTNNTLSLKDFLRGEFREFPLKYNNLIFDLIGEKTDITLEIIEQNPTIFDISFDCIYKEDLLGYIYMSLADIGNRKKNGAYYTPVATVEKLVKKLFFRQELKKSQTVLDPCCGSGNFLINLPEKFKLENIFAFDIDPISVKLARINLAIIYKTDDTSVLYKNIRCADFLRVQDINTYDFVLGNPPWGCKITADTKRSLSDYTTVKSKTCESYDVFIEKSIKCLKPDGKLSFVLPESVLKVKAHFPVRQVISDMTSIQYVEFLDNKFSKVLCPSIILQLCVQNNVNEIEVFRSNKFYTIKNSKSIENLNFYTNDKEYKILEKINSLSNRIYLKNNAKFALGIVTGDNAKYISKKQIENFVPVIKGTDIAKYFIKNPSNYINSDLSKFQQCAPKNVYNSQEKILYKFISKSIIAAYDNNQYLTLNSCNIIIPDKNLFNIKFVLSILNSSVIQFYYQKQFNCLKVLRNNIEQIPFPNVDLSFQKSFEDEINILLKNPDEKEIFEKLDRKIAELYALDEKDYEMIKKAFSK